MKFTTAQDLFRYNSPGIVEVDPGTIRSSSLTEMNLSRSKWTIFVPRNAGTVELKLDTNILDVTGDAHIALVGFNIWGGPYFNKVKNLHLIGCDWQFPLNEFDALPAKVKAQYSSRCKLGFFQGAQNCSVVASDLHDAGSGLAVSQTANFTYAGNYMHDLGPSRDPLWHTDSLGLVGGGTTALHVSDSQFDGYARFVFEDATVKDGTVLAGQPHKDVLFNNIWLNSSLQSLFQFVIRGNPPATIQGALSNLRIWGIPTTGVYRTETYKAGGVHYIHPGDKINLASQVHVTESNVQVVAKQPVGVSPQSSWWKLDPLNIAKLFTGLR